MCSLPRKRDSKGEANRTDNAELNTRERERLDERERRNGLSPSVSGTFSRQNDGRGSGRACDVISLGRQTEDLAARPPTAAVPLPLGRAVSLDCPSAENYNEVMVEVGCGRHRYANVAAVSRKDLS